MGNTLPFLFQAVWMCFGYAVRKTREGSTDVYCSDRPYAGKRKGCRKNIINNAKGESK
jgi:hypothetical protein